MLVNVSFNFLNDIVFKMFLVFVSKRLVDENTLLSSLIFIIFIHRKHFYPENWRVSFPLTRDELARG